MKWMSIYRVKIIKETENLLSAKSLANHKGECKRKQEKLVPYSHRIFIRVAKCRVQVMYSKCPKSFIVAL